MKVNENNANKSDRLARSVDTGSFCHVETLYLK